MVKPNPSTRAARPMLMFFNMVFAALFREKATEKFLVRDLDSPPLFIQKVDFLSSGGYD